MGRYFYVADMTTHEHAYLGKNLEGLFRTCIDLGDWLPVAWQGGMLTCPRLSPEAVELQYEQDVLEASDRPWLLEYMSELERDPLYKWIAARAGHDVILVCDDYLRAEERVLGWPCDEAGGVGFEDPPVLRFPAPWRNSAGHGTAEGWVKMPGPWGRA